MSPSWCGAGATTTWWPRAAPWAPRPAPAAPPEWRGWRSARRRACSPSCGRRGPMSDLRERASELDAADQLAAVREDFVLDDLDDAVYLDGNSLGALPVNVPGRLDDVVRREWGQLRIRSW